MTASAPFPANTLSPQQLASQIKAWGETLGFAAIGITGVELGQAPQRYREWLARRFHGDMDYLAQHQALRFDPAQLVPGTTSIICARLDYLPPEVETLRILESPEQAYISRYALGRDYHKMMRKRLARLAKQIETAYGAFGYRAFVDSAPVLEKPLGQQAGLGWQGKHTLLIDRRAGSYFFLGELFTNLPLAADTPYERDHCGHCSACLSACPTNAFPEPYVLDAARCISYLTIELKGSIPLELRPLIGNRVFGCDDCQLACPYNRQPAITTEADFYPRNDLQASDLVSLIGWSEAEFLKRTEGSPIRRAGHEGWLRNLAVGLGNSGGGEAALQALRQHADHPSATVREHIQWGIARLEQGAESVRPPLAAAADGRLRHLRRPTASYRGRGEGPLRG